MVQINRTISTLSVSRFRTLSSKNSAVCRQNRTIAIKINPMYASVHRNENMHAINWVSRH